MSKTSARHQALQEFLSARGYATIEELAADYTEEEIRLVRIKFMCEQGN